MKKRIFIRHPPFLFLPMSHRIEHDSLGAVHVPQDAYYGAQTQRAVKNFPISGLRLQKGFIQAQAMTKAAAAIANHQAERLSTPLMHAIVQAAEEVIEGKLDDHFVVDVYQVGAGTSQHMNMNEVLANRALEILGKGRGHYEFVHPNNHVNMGQSTNDTIPTAMHIAAHQACMELHDALTALQKALQVKADDFSAIYKSGRTHLQDAVPISLGQEFSGYTAMLHSNSKRLHTAIHELQALPIGGTAVGTGINTHASYQEAVIAQINHMTGHTFRPAANTFEAMQNTDAIVYLSATLKTLSVGLTKLANDLRLLASGPKAGLGEISLPAVQPGSSIMPGKVNPVMAEMLNMVAYQVAGNDLTITGAAQGAQLELNVMMPVIAYNILHSIEILTNGITAFHTHCVKGIQANKNRCQAYIDKNPIIATALTPHLGYEKTAAIVQQAYETDTSIKELIRKQGLLSEKQLNEILDYTQLVKPTM